MDTLRVLVADGSEEYRNALADVLRGAYHVRISAEGTEALELLRSFSPDILVLDLMLPGLDGISLLQSAAAADMHPMVLATTRFISNYILDSLEKLGVGYLMVKPCDARATVSRIADLTQRLKAPKLSLPDSRTAITNQLLSLGVPTKLRGYGCLREAIFAMSRDPGQSITKELYPSVACTCGGTPEQVERAIRSAIHAAWMNRDEQIWRLYFHSGMDGSIPRPTNAAFISRLADQLALEKDREHVESAG